jgi:hypothetical protein
MKSTIIVNCNRDRMAITNFPYEVKGIIGWINVFPQQCGGKYNKSLLDIGEQSDSSIGYFSAIVPSSANLPFGQYPPIGKPAFTAASNPARSTPVCPPETTFLSISAS